MTGIAASTKADSLGLVTTIIVIAPTNKKRLASANEAEAPKVALSCVVSAERREAMSPVFSASNNWGSGRGQVGEEIRAKVGDHPLAERHDQVVSRAGCEREHRDDADHGQKISADEAGVRVRKSEVNHPPDQRSARRASRLTRRSARPAPRQCARDRPTRKARAASRRRARRETPSRRRRRRMTLG